MPNEKNILIGISKTGMHIEKCDNLYISLIAPRTGIHIEKCDNLYINLIAPKTGIHIEKCDNLYVTDVNGLVYFMCLNLIHEIHIIFIIILIITLE